jgi:hypothetical protein
MRSAAAQEIAQIAGGIELQTPNGSKTNVPG